MPPSHLPEHRIGIFVRFASSISAAAPETAARKRMPLRRSRCERSTIGKPQSCAGERLMAAPWHGTIGKLQSTIGKPHDTIGKQENT